MIYLPQRLSITIGRSLILVFQAKIRLYPVDLSSPPLDLVFSLFFFETNLFQLPSFSQPFSTLNLCGLLRILHSYKGPNHSLFSLSRKTPFPISHKERSLLADRTSFPLAFFPAQLVIDNFPIPRIQLYFQLKIVLFSCTFDQQVRIFVFVCFVPQLLTSSSSFVFPPALQALHTLRSTLPPNSTTPSLLLFFLLLLCSLTFFVPSYPPTYCFWPSLFFGSRVVS